MRIDVLIKMLNMSERQDKFELSLLSVNTSGRYSEIELDSLV